MSVAGDKYCLCLLAKYQISCSSKEFQNNILKKFVLGFINFTALLNSFYFTQARKWVGASVSWDFIRNLMWFNEENLYLLK